ncbi:hypothetical protein ASG57_34755 [Bradyrhizobium sp. Leaf396]|nr:hypothetical protein ASG57_34755 [Bradyrhizobium sp. Leaf396]
MASRLAVAATSLAFRPLHGTFEDSAPELRSLKSALFNEQMALALECLAICNGASGAICEFVHAAERAPIAAHLQ